MKKIKVLAEESKDDSPLSDKQSMKLLQVQKDILEIVIDSNDHQKTLEALCKAAEGIVSNAVASVMIFNKQLNSLFVRAAPNIPDSAIEQLNGLIPGKNAGSCGSAVYSGEPQYVANTLCDRRWKTLKPVALEFNIKACWSMPVKDRFGETIGSFALSSFENRAPSTFQKNLLQTASYLVTLILSREHSDHCIEKLSNSDPLTELPNRGYFEKRINKALENAKNNASQLSLIFIDLDDFKPINDTFGHAEGDKVLCSVAKRLAGRIRNGDSLARIGGDEFVILIEDVPSEDEIYTIAAELIDLLNKPIKTKENVHQISASLGISFYPKDANSVEKLLNFADKAMYKAKKSGKNRFH
jgi:diguanylate cyclase (GGDEF)-like protein